MLDVAPESLRLRCHWMVVVNPYCCAFFLCISLRIYCVQPVHTLRHTGRGGERVRPRQVPDGGPMGSSCIGESETESLVSLISGQVS